MFKEIKPHLVELRRRLIYTFSLYFVLFAAAFTYWKEILYWMTLPLSQVLDKESEVIFTALSEPFFVALKVSLFTAFLVELPFILYQTWRFIAPGLYSNEKKFILPFVIFGTTMFAVGSAFAYFVVFPFGFEYLINFADGLFVAMPKISEYVTFFSKLIIGFGVAFELPVATFFLAKMGLVTEKTLINFFRYAVIIIFVFSAVLTPPDVVTQLLMAIPLLILYVISIGIAKIVNPHTEEISQEE